MPARTATGCQPWPVVANQSARNARREREDCLFPAHRFPTENKSTIEMETSKLLKAGGWEQIWYGHSLG
jgi:hypothetical protein